MEGEQILEQAEGTIVQDAPDDGQGIDSIFSDALKEKGGTPEDASHTDEEGAEKQVEEEAEAIEETQKAKAEAEKLFGELVHGETQKIAFKNEDEFKKFVESNPLLKDGFLRLQDYTRKTQQVAEDRKVFEKKQAEQEQADLEVWGGEKPDPESLKSLGDIWTVFRHAPSGLAQVINSFVSDIQLIASGRAPVGPLAGGNGQFSPQDSQIIELRKQMDQIRRESATQGKRFETEHQKIALDRATEMLSAWEGKMKTQGIVVERDEYEQMASHGFKIGKPKANGETYTFDDAYKATLAELGRSEKLVTKKVLTRANDLKKKTPILPTARVPANARPRAGNDLDAIFEEGARQLKE